MIKTILIVALAYSCLDILIFDHWPLVSSEAVIGDWKQLNTKRCGISRLTGQIISDCFVWHNTDDLSKVINGRNRTDGEAPWLVLVARMQGRIEWNSACAGAIIADQWVLTAAHCVRPVVLGDGPEINHRGWELTVVTGHNVTANQWMGNRLKVNDTTKGYGITQKQFDAMYHNFRPVGVYVHPPLKVKRYNKTANRTSSSEYHDIALVKLDRPIDSSNYEGKDWPYENSICLPTEHLTGVERDEYAVTGGYGMYEYDKPEGRMLAQMAPRRIRHKYNMSILMMTHNVESSAVCKGDSGAPLWQYDVGRAVLVGVLVKTELDPVTGFPRSCSTTSTQQPLNTFHERVSRYIDWIINVTGLDRQHLAESGHTPEFVDYYNETVDCRDTGECLNYNYMLAETS